MTATSLSQRESQLPPATLEGSPRLVSWSDPGSFQMTAFVLGLGVCEILHVPFKNEVFVSFSSLIHKPHQPSKPDVLGLSSWCRTPRLGSLMWGSDPYFLGRTSAIVTLPFVSFLPGGMDLDYHYISTSLYLLLNNLWFLHYILHFEKSLLLAFIPFSFIVGL